MKAPRTVTIALAALTIALANPATLRAAGSTTMGTNTASHDLLVVRTGTVYGSLTILPAQSGQAARGLPSGLFSRDGHVLYAAFPQGSGDSLIQALDARSGRVLRTVTVQGYYSTMPGNLTPGALLDGGAGANRAAFAWPAMAGVARITQALPGAAPIDSAEILSALSYNGRWLALRDATPNTPDTAAVVIDTTRMRVVATPRLHGAFGLDAIDNAGRRLYLVQKRDNAGPQAYQVRAYDLRARRLDQTPLTEPDDPAGIIRGVAYTRAWSPRGDWLYTLYVRPGKGGAFVHALGVAYHKVHCIMLPAEVTTGVASTRDALAVSPDGATLYAVNPVLGRMVVVHDLPYGHVTQVNLGRQAGARQSMERAVALSHDGRTMFVATDRGIWAVDTATRRVRTVYAEGEQVASIALDGDGQRLYALEPASGRIEALDANSGRALAGIQVTAAMGAPWAIEQVMSV